MDKRFWLILSSLTVIAIIVAVIFGGGGKSNNAKPTEHVTGQGSTGVKLVEYGDFQCPACGDWYPTVEQIAHKYKSQIYFQFRNYPLASLHPHALAAARAAEAAGLQGKYWEMYNKLYSQNMAYYNSNQSAQTWINADKPMQFFSRYAGEIGLNVKKFEKDFDSAKINDRIQADLNAGQKLGIKGTPSFFIDGKEVDLKQLSDNGQPSLEAFSKLIDQAIEAKTGHKVKDTKSTNQTQPAATRQQNTKKAPPETKIKQ